MKTHNSSAVLPCNKQLWVISPALGIPFIYFILLVGEFYQETVRKTFYVNSSPTRLFSFCCIAQSCESKFYLPGTWTWFSMASAQKSWCLSLRRGCSWSCPFSFAVLFSSCSVCLLSSIIPQNASASHLSLLVLSFFSLPLVDYFTLTGLIIWRILLFGRRI